MKLILERIGEIRSAQRPNSNAVSIQCDMNEGQMYDAILEFLTQISDDTWAKWCEEIDGMDHPFAGVDKKSKLHAMCVCMAARLEDCANLLENQKEVCRATGYLGGIRNLSESASEARKLIKQWERL